MPATNINSLLDPNPLLATSDSKQTINVNVDGYTGDITGALNFSNNFNIKGDSVTSDLDAGSQNDRVTIKGDNFDGDIDLAEGKDKVTVSGDNTDADITKTEGELNLSIKGSGQNITANTTNEGDLKLRANVKDSSVDVTTDDGIANVNVRATENSDIDITTGLGGAKAGKVSAKTEDSSFSFTAEDGDNKINLSVKESTIDGNDISLGEGKQNLKLKAQSNGDIDVTINQTEPVSSLESDLKVNATADDFSDITINSTVASDSKVSLKATDGSQASITLAEGNHTAKLTAQNDSITEYSAEANGENTVNVSIKAKGGDGGADANSITTTGSGKATIKGSVSNDSSLNASTGSGDDSVNITVSNNASATIDTGEGNDQIKVNVQKDSSVEINGGDGEDSIFVNLSNNSNATIQANENPDLDRGSAVQAQDDIIITGSNASFGASLNRNDNLTVDGENIDGFIDFRSATVGDVTINGENFSGFINGWFDTDSTVTFNSAEVSELSAYNVNLQFNAANKLQFNEINFNTEVNTLTSESVDITAENLIHGSINLGDGSDQVTITENLLFETPTAEGAMEIAINGGAGYNTLTSTGNVHTGTLLLSGIDVADLGGFDQGWTDLTLDLDNSAGIEITGSEFDDNLTLLKSTSTEDATIDLLDGNDSILIDDNAGFNGTFNGGEGDDTVNILGTFNGTINTGSGNDTIGLDSPELDPEVEAALLKDKLLELPLDDAAREELEEDIANLETLPAEIQVEEFTELLLELDPEALDDVALGGFIGDIDLGEGDDTFIIATDSTVSGNFDGGEGTNDTLDLGILLGDADTISGFENIILNNSDASDAVIPDPDNPDDEPLINFDMTQVSFDNDAFITGSGKISGLIDISTDTGDTWLFGEATGGDNAFITNGDIVIDLGTTNASYDLSSDILTVIA